MIIPADDLGVAHSENAATIKAMESVVVNSASNMVPTPRFTEIASYVDTNPKADFGLHLTVTSEKAKQILKENNIQLITWRENKR